MNRSPSGTRRRHHPQAAEGCALAAARIIARAENSNKLT
jgi:hypothetical protein